MLVPAKITLPAHYGATGQRPKEGVYWRVETPYGSSSLFWTDTFFRDKTLWSRAEDKSALFKTKGDAILAFLQRGISSSLPLSKVRVVDFQWVA